MEMNSKYLDIVKWIFAGVIFVLFDKVSDNYFKGRDANDKEMNFNSKFVDDIVSQPDKVGQQKNLAEYFACLSVQLEVREGWIKYYELKKKEYETLQAEEKRLLDSIYQYKYDASGNLRKNLSAKESEVLNSFEHRKYEIKQKLNSKITFNNNTSNEPENIDRLEYDAYFAILANDAKSAMLNLDELYKIKPTYKNIDELRKYIKNNINSLESGNEKAWLEFYKIIIEKYSWKLPPEILEALKLEVKNS